MVNSSVKSRAPRLLKRKTAGDVAFDIVNALLIVLVCLVMLYPFVYILSISVTPHEQVPYVTLLPRGFSLDVYRYIFSMSSVQSGYLNSLFYTLAGTALSMFLTICTAYPLSKSWMPGRRALVVFILITMYFGGGLIPLFVMINEYGLYNTRWAVLITSALSTYNVMVMNSFFKGLPRELEEACEVDGASELTTLVRVILPLSKPILATIGLFYAVGQWNAWFNSYIFLNDKELYPIQLVLRNLMATVGTGLDKGDMSAAAQVVGGKAENINSTSLNYALTVAVVAPILFVYPFVQKYFVKGVMVGSLKG